MTFAKGRREEMSIKIYYFNLPTCKQFRYDANTTIGYLIGEAIQAYLQDPKLDHQKIKNIHPSSTFSSILDYELRLLLD